MADLYRRCGCINPASKRAYPNLPSSPSEAQKAAACPTLVKDKSHGSWGYSVSGGINPGTGKRVQERKMGFATRAEANESRAAAVTRFAAGNYRASATTTIAEWMPKWLERRIEDGLKASTAFGYRQYIERDIVPGLGALRLSKLRKSDVDKFLRDMRVSGRGLTAIHRCHAVLSAALSTAEQLDMINHNPASKIALPKLTKTRTKPWEPEQVGEFLDYVADVRIAPLLDLALFTGLRRGELAGLRWADVDLTQRRLIVRQARTQVGRTVVEGTVKTDSGQDRDVSLGSDAVGSLIAWKLRQDEERAAWGDAWQDGGWCFTYEDGRPLRPEYISQTFDRLVERSGLPKLRFHDLRHQHASLLLSGGVDIAIVSKRLGHSNIAITSDLYSHLLSGANQRAADAGEAMIPRRGGSQHKVSTNTP